MTAAHRDAGLVVCPDCHQPRHHRCVWPDGRERKVPCLNRMRAAERFDGTDPATHSTDAGFDAQGVVQLDSGPPECVHTEPLHPQENQ